MDDRPNQKRFFISLKEFTECLVNMYCDVHFVIDMWSLHALSTYQAAPVMTRMMQSLFFFLSSIFSEKPIYRFSKTVTHCIIIVLLLYDVYKNFIDEMKTNFWGECCA